MHVIMALVGFSFKFTTHKFKTNQKSYSKIEKEALEILLALEKLKVYLTCTGNPITVNMDHNPLVFIEKVKFKNIHILRWAISLHTRSHQGQG